MSTPRTDPLALLAVEADARARAELEETQKQVIAFNAETGFSTTRCNLLTSTMFLSTAPLRPTIASETSTVPINGDHFAYPPLPGSQQHFISTVPSPTEPNPARAAAQPPVLPAASPAGQSTTSSTSPLSKQKNRRKPSFAMKLHAILADKNWRSVITWLPSGKSFFIIDKEEFTKKCLPKYFREAKFESFSRRLKRWGFSKIYMTSQSQVVYSHELFQRDRLDLCEVMNGHSHSSNSESYDDKLKLEHYEKGTPQLEVAKLKRSAEAAPLGTDVQRPQMQHLLPPQVPQLASPHAQFMMGYQSSAPQTTPYHQMYMNHVPMAPMAFQPQSSRFHTCHQMQYGRNVGSNFAMYDTFQPKHSTEVNPSVSREIFNLEDDIIRCEEQLAILHRLKMLKSKYHALQR